MYFGTLDIDIQVEQNERSIVTLLEISDDEQDMEEEDNRKLSLPLYRYIQNMQASTQRVRRVSR
jgi:hypothetical protein